jgi:dipeptidyl aminopeptidase/acylaminoacyl peptidase
MGRAIPELTADVLQPKRPVSYTSRDGVEIPGYLTLPDSAQAGPLPTVILPHGGPKDRDDIRFSYLVQFLASRGYAVLQPNFRGSTGYGQKFMEAGIKQWGGRMQDDVSDGVQWLIDEGIADANRVCIVGWSYGGYSAMMGAIKTPDLYRCAASINGVMDLARLREQDKTELVGGEAWVAHMGLDGESVKSVSPLHRAESIEVPVLIVQARDDVRVTDEHGRNMTERLRKLDKEVDYLEIERGGHSLITAAGRAQMLAGLEEFLARHLE